MEDIIDQGNTGGQGVPQAVKTLGILSIVGSSLWGLLILIAMFWIMGQTSGLSALFPPEMASMMTAIYVVMVIMVALNALGIMGAMKMMKGNKGGFTLYAVVTGLWALLLLLAGLQGDLLSIVSALASIGFIIGFGMQMKNM